MWVPISLWKRIITDLESVGTRTGDGCLIWNHQCGGKAPWNDWKGYGMTRYQGNGRKVQVPRVVVHYYVDAEFPVFYDPITTLVPDHLCDDTRCIEPQHLDIVTKSVNTARGRGSALNPNKTSQYVGVHWDDLMIRWRATIRIDGKQKSLGLFWSEEEAKHAYRVAYLLAHRKRKT